MSDNLSELSKRVYGPGNMKSWWNNIRPDKTVWPQFAIHPFDFAGTVKSYTLPALPGMSADAFAFKPEQEQNRSANPEHVDPIQPGIVNPAGYPQTFLSEYHPSWRESVFDFLAGSSREGTFRRNLVGGTLGDPWSSRFPDDVGFVDFTPFSIPFTVDEAYRSLKAGNYGNAALEVASIIPVARIASAVNKIRKARKAWAPVQLQNKGGSIYPPPKVEPVPFNVDYPETVPVDESGRLTHTMDGDPLVARYVAGRREAGGPNVGLTNEEWQDIIQLSTKKPVRYGPKSIFKNPRTSVGAFNPQGEVKIWDQLQSPQKELVMAHEGGHVIDYHAGEPVKLSKKDVVPYYTIPEAKNSKTELKTIFNDLNNSELYAARQKNPDINPKDIHWDVTPERPPFKYTGKYADLERMAEAIRAYGSNPDYMKKVAPKTAKQIRKFVNNNKALKNIIQFNSLIPAAASIAALWNILGMYSDDEEF